MKRRRIASFAVAGSATMFQFAIPIPGCESMVLGPRTFFDQNTCNIFNCDTLFFLRDDHIDDEHNEILEPSDEHDDNGAEESEDHTHG